MTQHAKFEDPSDSNVAYATSKSSLSKTRFWMGRLGYTTCFPGFESSRIDPNNIACHVPMFENCYYISNSDVVTLELVIRTWRIEEIV